MTKDQFLESYTYQPSKHKIGGGSFGTVYRAYDRINDREVAIKVQQVEHKNGKELSLKMEYEAIKALEAHPNIANYEKVYRYEESVGVMDYAIMQFYQSGNLSKYLREGKPDNAQKERILVQLLRGIAYLHLNNVVHRDIKPGNILVVERPDEGIIPKITDFGLSKRAEIDNNSTKFENSFAGGTIEYCSPEQLRGSELKFNTDLWSYGIIIFEVFTGRKVFNAKEFEAGSMGRMGKIAEMILRKDISGELEKLPALWRPIARMCLERNQDDRPATGKDLLVHLPKEMYDADKDYFLKKAEVKEMGYEDDKTITVSTDEEEDDDVTFLADNNNSLLEAENEITQSKRESVSTKSGKNKKLLLITTALVLIGIIFYGAITIIIGTDAPKNLAMVIEDGRAGYIDKTGNMVIQPQFSNGLNFSDGLAAINDDTGWNYINHTGEIAIRGNYDMALPFSDGLAPVLNDEKWLFIDKKGNAVFQQAFDDANVFRDGLAPVKLGKEWVYIDKTGKKAFAETFETAFYFSEGLASVKKKGGWGFIDIRGGMVIPYKYLAAKDYSEGVSAVKLLNGQWSFIDDKGNTILDKTYEGAKDFSEGLVGVKYNGKWGFINKKGVLVIDFKYDNVGGFSEGLAPVKVKKKWGFIDDRGEEIIKPKYSSVGEFN